jgi:hypothetical protein
VYHGIVILHCVAREYPREPALSEAHRSNYLFWKAVVLPPLHGVMMLGLLDGTDTAPNKTLEVEDCDKKTTVPNLAYDTHGLPVINMFSDGW